NRRELARHRVEAGEAHNGRLVRVAICDLSRDRVHVFRPYPHDAKLTTAIPLRCLQISDPFLVTELGHPALDLRVAEEVDRAVRLNLMFPERDNDRLLVWAYCGPRPARISRLGAEMRKRSREGSPLRHRIASVGKVWRRRE